MYSFRSLYSNSNSNSNSKRFICMTKGFFLHDKWNAHDDSEITRFLNNIKKMNGWQRLHVLSSTAGNNSGGDSTRPPASLYIQACFDDGSTARAQLLNYRCNSAITLMLFYRNNLRLYFFSSRFFLAPVPRDSSNQENKSLWARFDFDEASRGHVLHIVM